MLSYYAMHKGLASAHKKFFAAYIHNLGDIHPKNLVADLYTLLLANHHARKHSSHMRSLNVSESTGLSRVTN